MSAPSFFLFATVWLSVFAWAGAELLKAARPGAASSRVFWAPMIPSWLDPIDVGLTRWMARYGIAMLRVSLGIIFFWFGVLKFFPGLSPAQDLAARTIDILTFGIVPANVAIPALAAWECAIGFGLIAGVWLRAVLLLLFVQMLGTLAPVALFPGEVFVRIPYAPTLEGQYIIKNLVLISSAIVVGATVRGGALVADEAERRG